MYATGIGLIIETIARMEHDRKLEAAKESKKPVKTVVAQTAETVVEEVTVEEEVITKKPRNKGEGFSMKNIVASVTKLFTADDIK